MTLIGSGENLFPAGKVAGLLRRIDTPEQVLELLDEEGEPVIVWTNFAGSTFLSPVMDKIAGIITATGTSKGHLAIVARELGLPCVLGAKMEHCESGQSVLLDCTDNTTARIYLL
jgi:phosphoenolpyruvate-protein kinase (PTS system EI component)